MTGQPVLNPRKEKRERKAVRGGREKMTKRESEREKWGVGREKERRIASSQRQEVTLKSS